MPLYTVIFEKNGERVATYTVHAADEIGARAACDARFRDNPEYDPRRKETDLSIRVEKAESHFR
jgi:hypothetical protein